MPIPTSVVANVLFGVASFALFALVELHQFKKVGWDLITSVVSSQVCREVG
jgi:hypothetical protein